jgi:peptidoglycan/LPS O-acetylase OafA/YrhL
LSPSLGIGASCSRERPAELPGLTPLRGIAAVSVVFFHSSSVAYHFAGGGLWAFWRRGYLAVDLFFLLSGFVLTHVYGRHLAERRNWRAIGGFLWARFCRIYPASLFTTSVFVLAFTVGHLSFPTDASFTKQVAAAVLLMQVPWLDSIVINIPSWSISAEWYAYLLFPFVVPSVLRLTSHAAGLLGLGLLIAIATIHMVFAGEQTSGWGALVRALPEFTVGILAYRAYSKRVLRTICQKDATFVTIVAIIVLACAAGVSDGPIVILLLALLLASVCNSGRIAGILNTKPLRWLGEVSYSVYIFQTVPFMFAMIFAGVLSAHMVDGPVFATITALLAIGSGVLVHRCVDVPARAWLRRMPDRLAATAAVVYRMAKIGPLTPVPATLPERRGPRIGRGVI